MSDFRLERLFAPREVCLVGASPRPGTLGHAILANLRRASPATPPIPVNPKHRSIDGLRCYASLRDLPRAPDLVVIATPPRAVNEVISQAGEMGAAAAIVITAGLGHGEGSLSDKLRIDARAHGLRVVGPNCVGVVAPRAGLDASFLARPVRPGNLALISQSGAIVATLVEWAHDHQVGFSGIVSLGDQIDVDFADCLDYFALDRNTDAILLYVESIQDARKFLAAARAATSMKPVIVVKAGRHAAGSRAALSHTGAMTGADSVYDAAFRRAGLLRVIDIEELFAAAGALSHGVRVAGDRVGVLTNGGGIGVLAVDRLVDFGATIATLSPSTLSALDKVLPDTWSRANPIDIIGDADAARYEAATRIALQSDDLDALIALNCPTALVSSVDAARAVAAAVADMRRQANKESKEGKPVFAVWFGENHEIDSAFESAGIPRFGSEVDAARGLSHLIAYRRARLGLLASPPAGDADFRADIAAARAAITTALAAGREWLDPIETTQLLAAYGVPFAACARARDRREAEAVARDMLSKNHSLAMKILSPDITHKSDVGGVRLHVRTPDGAGRVFDDILNAVAAQRPQAKIDGVILQPMIERPNAIELIAGLADDPTFGPVLLFGHGGTAVEAINDRALALPPLDEDLARAVIARTRVARLLAGYRDVPAADLAAIATILTRLGTMSADLPEIREIDLNPLLADAESVIAVDARVRVAPAPIQPGFSNPRFAIRPYPREWETSVTLPGGAICDIRPLRPGDAALYETFFRHVSPQDLHRRFFVTMREVSPELIARLTQIDYARTIVLLGIDRASGELLGVVRAHADAARERGEYAIITRSDFHGRGLGWALMSQCIAIARREGLRELYGQVLAENRDMLDMCRELGFEIHPAPGEADIRSVRLDLKRSSAPLSAP